MKGFGFIAAVSTLVIAFEVSKFWPWPQTKRSFPFSKVLCRWQVRNSICWDNQCLRSPRLWSPCGPPSKELKLTLGLVTEVLGLEVMGLLSGGHRVLSPHCAASLTLCSHRAASVPTTAGGELGSDSRTFRLLSTMFHCFSPECVRLAIGWPSHWDSFWCPHLLPSTLQGPRLAVPAYSLVYSYPARIEAAGKIYHVVGLSPAWGRLLLAADGLWRWWAHVDKWLPHPAFIPHENNHKNHCSVKWRRQ